MTDEIADPLPVGEQEAVLSSAGSGVQVAAPAPITAAAVTAAQRAARAAETPELRYMRETRSAAVFIAVVVGIVATLSLIAVIVVGVQLGKVNSQLANLNGGVSGSCLSQGGTDPSC